MTTIVPGDLEFGASFLLLQQSSENPEIAKA